MTTLDDRQTLSQTTTEVAAPERATLKQWLSVAAVALGVFVVMTSEVLPVGLLTPISGDLGVSAGTAGLILFRHRANFRRLRSGTERRL